MKRTVRLNERDLTNLVKRIVKENKNEERNIGRIIEDIISSFEFSDIGNDEMVIFADFLMDEGNAKQLAQSIYQRLKQGYGAHQDDEKGFGIYSKNRDRLKDFEKRLGM
jgi:superfamily I DNA and RNA helicase